MPTMTDTKPTKVEGKPARVKGQPRYKQGFNFPLPVDEITKYKESTKWGQRLTRASIEQDVADYLIGQANETMEKYGGVEGIMKRVLGS